MFWCPVSAVQPTEKRKVHARGRQAVVKVIPKDVPAGPFRQVDCRGRPAVCRRCGRGAQNVVVAEVLGNQRRRNPSVVRCYAALCWLGACTPRRVARRSPQMALPVRNGVS